ncbi:AAEL007466-PA [Aedes aegypti]|uniref:Chromatin accessibility complex protein 1 n=2 Tax=Aedes aegypti TaxID=7159 RepID=A0A1S4FGS1_AEDAE|nr:chromatin accessibility complex protein 1 [Aedes aegypti]EAT40840.1 AAEL007466-PA [Aedes aegypti]
MDQDKSKHLPMSRIRTVMKTSPSIGHINQDALFLVCRAAEMFIQFISKNAYKKGTQLLNYKHLASYVESEGSLEFLEQILPKKITVSQYKKIMEQKKNKGSDDDDSSSEEEDSSSSGEESDDEGSDSSSESGEGEEEEEEEEDDGDDKDGEEQKDDDADSVISIDSSSSDEKENSKNMSNKKSPIKHKTGDSP